MDVLGLEGFRARGFRVRVKDSRVEGSGFKCCCSVVWGLGGLGLGWAWAFRVRVYSSEIPN